MRLRQKLSERHSATWSPVRLLLPVGATAVSGRDAFSPRVETAGAVVILLPSGRPFPMLSTISSDWLAAGFDLLFAFSFSLPAAGRLAVFASPIVGQTIHPAGRCSASALGTNFPYSTTLFVGTIDLGSLRACSPLNALLNSDGLSWVEEQSVRR